MFVKIALTALTVLCLLSCTAQSQIAEQRAPTVSESQTSLEEAVRKAFAEASKGNPQAVYQLPKSVETIKYLEPYLNSDDKNTRIVVIRFLDTLKSEAAIPLLVRGVADAERYNAERASEILYKSFDRKTLQNEPNLPDILAKSVHDSSNSIASYALLGYFPSDASRPLLTAKCRQASEQSASLEYFERQKSLVACVVLSELGTENGNLLLEKFRTEQERSGFFLLENLDLIRDPKTLEIVFRNAITDDSPINAVFVRPGVPNPNPATEPRLLDVAVNKFAERLKTNVGFNLKEGARYSKPQIAAARRQILARLAALKSK